MEALKEVRMEKTYEAPLDQVWQAWTDPEMLKQWWGPDNVIIPECEIDLRVGGQFYIVMEAGEAMGPYKGTRWPMRAEFTSVEPHSRLAYDAIAWTEGHEDDMRIEQATEVKFSQEDGKTKVAVKAAIYKMGPAAGMAAEGMQAGFSQQLEKLGKFLDGK